jgi:hypothetical protein
MRKEHIEMHRFTTSIRVAGVVAALVLVAGATSASARTHHQSRHETASGLSLTYTKWFAPGFPNMVGTVGGDVNGQFGGAVLRAVPDPTGRFIHLSAIYIVIAPDPSESLTMRVDGVQDNQSGTAVLDGRVVDGYLRGAHVHAEYTVISNCAQASGGVCFQGTIKVHMPKD